ncbi:MAG: hypothetical protein GY757_48290 [bacterium]|nr:hypothetical protein [bacterium]
MNIERKGQLQNIEGLLSNLTIYAEMVPGRNSEAVNQQEVEERRELAERTMALLSINHDIDYKNDTRVGCKWLNPSSSPEEMEAINRVGCKWLNPSESPEELKANTRVGCKWLNPSATPGDLLN